jgi:hypothetical protein
MVRLNSLPSISVKLVSFYSQLLPLWYVKYLENVRKAHRKTDAPSFPFLFSSSDEVRVETYCWWHMRAIAT